MKEPHRAVLARNQGANRSKRSTAADLRQAMPQVVLEEHLRPTLLGPRRHLLADPVVLVVVHAEEQHGVLLPLRGHDLGLLARHAVVRDVLVLGNGGRVACDNRAPRV